jgi:HEAT repeat protein
LIPPDDPVPGEDLSVYVEEALRVLRRNAPEAEKLVAMTPIENMCHPLAMPAIMLALEDDSLLVRDAAVEAMKFMDDPAVVPAVVRALDDSDATIREDALVALNILVDESINDPLSKALEDEHSDVRSAAFDVMLLQCSPIVLPTLEKAVTADDAELQRDAVTVLEEIPDPRALDLLINEALLSDHDSVRDDAAAALTRITGITEKSYPQWSQWWEKNRASAPVNFEEDDWRAFWSDFRKALPGAD